MVFCVGLTGTIGSGKSTVAGFFAEWGVDIISADHSARELTSLATPACRQIEAHFGSQLFDASGALDRRLLRQTILANAEERRWLEELLHPMILQDIQQRVTASKAPYCMVEIPLLIDKQTYPFINRILLITTEASLQLARVMQRDQCSQEEALLMIGAQASLALYLQTADDCLENNGGYESLRQGAYALHQRYLDLR